MTIPNKITFFRLFITPIAVALLLLPQLPYNYLISTIIFIIAMISDVLDGFIARRYDMTTKLGSFLDPLSDKLIILLYFIFLQSAGLYPLWLLLAFFARELIVDGFRSYAVSQNIYVGAITAGKIKAGLQTFSIIAGLILLTMTNNQLFGLIFNQTYLEYFVLYTMILSLITSLIGMTILLKRNIAVFK